MNSMTEEISNIITKELSKPDENKMAIDVIRLLNEMRKAGLIKQPSYNLPLVDTIGRRFYGKINNTLNL